jgi:hypothetical protein
MSLSCTKIRDGGKRFVPKKCIGSLRSICSYFVYEIPRIVCPSSDFNVTHILVYATKNTY